MDDCGLLDNYGLLDYCGLINDGGLTAQLPCFLVYFKKSVHRQRVIGLKAVQKRDYFDENARFQWFEDAECNIDTAGWFKREYELGGLILCGSDPSVIRGNNTNPCVSGVPVSVEKDLQWDWQ